MDDLNTSGAGLQQSLLKWGLGFFGAIAAFKLLPKTIKFFTRRFVFGLLSEIVLVVIAALLTEKAADRLVGRDREEEWSR